MHDDIIIYDYVLCIVCDLGINNRDELPNDYLQVNFMNWPLYPRGKASSNIYI